MIKFVLVDFGGMDGLVTQARMEACAAAFTKMLHSMLALPQPLGWNMDGVMRVARGPTDVDGDESVVALLKHEDQPGAYGYHDKTPSGRPFEKVFPELLAADGAPWEPVVAHEGIEAGGNPEINSILIAPDGKLWAAEHADPNEQGIVVIDGVPLSDYVLPPWYGACSGPCNALNTLSPFEVGPGGYAQWLVDPVTGQWQQKLHASVQPRAYRMQHHGRSARMRGRLAAFKAAAAAAAAAATPAG